MHYECGACSRAKRVQCPMKWDALLTCQCIIPLQISVAAFLSFSPSSVIHSSTRLPIRHPSLFSGSNTLPSFYHVPSGSLYSPGYTPWGHRPSWEQHSKVAVETETKVYTQLEPKIKCIALGDEKRRGGLQSNGESTFELELHHSCCDGSIAQFPMNH